MTSFVAIVPAVSARTAEARDGQRRLSFRVPLSADGSSPPTHYGGHLTIDTASGVPGMVAGWPEVVASSYDPITGERGKDHFDLVLAANRLQRCANNVITPSLKLLAGVTGSMTAGSSVLSLTAPAPAIEVGDMLIVEIGGEAGGGVRGTVGVGGSWPAQSYPNAATIQAQTPADEQLFAWDEEMGNVWRWLNNTWAQQAYYYSAKVIPRALIATVMAVDDTEVTLDTEAVVDTAGASVHIDMKGVINAFFDAAGYPSIHEVAVPAGTYAVSGRLLIENRPHWVFRGAGSDQTTLFSPRGTSALQVEIVNSGAAVLRDMTLQSNVFHDNYGLGWDSGRQTETAAALPGWTPQCIYVRTCRDVEIRNVEVRDAYQAINPAACAGVWARNVNVTFVDGVRDYTQWMFQWADSFGGGVEDCNIFSPTLVTGPQSFGSVNTVFRRMELLNATISVNAGGGFTFEDIDMLIEAGAQDPNSVWPFYSNPLLYIGANAGDRPATSVPGLIRNIDLVVEGYVYGNGSSQGLSVTRHFGGLVVENYSYTGPDYADDATFGNGAVGLYCEAHDILLTDITISGTTQGFPWANVMVQPSATLVNVVCDEVDGAKLLTEPNAYLPGGPRYDYPKSIAPTGSISGRRPMR